jgi:hypothetical protein
MSDLYVKYEALNY